MIPKIAVIAAALVLAALLLWRPARTPIVQSVEATSQPDFSGEPGTPRYHRTGRHAPVDDPLIVYVTGAVKKPGLYHLHEGDRNARAVALAGGFTATADAAGVNLAQRATDGDEIAVPAVGESARVHTLTRHSHRRSHAAPPSESVDVNRSDAVQLAAVPGIGRAIAQRIVELREREGSFGSLDELLDVAGMTQTRLERARPYLRQP